MDQYYWVPHNEKAWIHAQPLTSKNTASTITFLCENGEISLNEADKVVVPAQSTSIFSNMDDLSKLEELTHGAVLHQLRNRYAIDEIYTNIGTILVSINPYKVLPLYTPSIMHSYINQNITDTLPPHVFQISSNIFNEMKQFHEDQSIIISGESGSGKTESTKLILQYLAEVASSDEGLEQQIMATVPLLEAFGNAKTLKNNNSSRFGKWLQIKFDDDLKIVDASLENYLLEKTRVITQSEGERNYHMFYYIFHGCSRQEKKDFFLDHPMQFFHYLNQGHCFKAEDINDKQGLQDVKNSMQILNFPSGFLVEIMKTIAAILHLGNLNFLSNEEELHLSQPEQCKRVCNLLNINDKNFLQSLLFRQVIIKNEVSIIRRNIKEVIETRDALGKFLYSLLFDTIIHQINMCFEFVPSTLNIGVLDIYGFEIFQDNYFEQLCINYANEKLQHFFNHHLFTIEQQQYDSEGVQVEYIDFIDNIPTLHLIDGNQGLFKLLDDCITRDRTDQQWFNVVKDLHQDHLSLSLEKLKPNEFIVHHYAGDVNYQIQGFVMKNNDSMHRDIIDVLLSSSSSFLHLLLQDFSENHQPIKQETTTRERNESFGFNSLREKANQAASGKTKQQKIQNVFKGATKKEKNSLSKNFSTSLNKLMQTLNSTHPHFLRCIKPNTTKQPNHFNSHEVLTQMKYAGLFEAIRIRRAGFAYRKKHDKFVQRYALCGLLYEKDVNALLQADPTIVVNVLVEDFLTNKDINPNNIQVGKSMVFYRSDVMIFLESLRIKAIEQPCLIVQCWFRRFQSRVQLKIRRRLVQSMQEAISKRDYNNIVSIMNEVNQQQIVLPIFTQAKKILDESTELQRLKQLLTESFSSKNLLQIQALLMECSSHSNFFKDKEYQKIIDDCQTLSIHLENVQQYEIHLREAIELQDHKLLQEYITAAQNEDVDQSLLQKAQITFNQLDSLENTRKNLAAASMSQNLETLQKAITDAVEFGLDIKDHDFKQCYNDFLRLKIFECEQSNNWIELKTYLQQAHSYNITNEWIDAAQWKLELNEKKQQYTDESIKILELPPDELDINRLRELIEAGELCGIDADLLSKTKDLYSDFCEAKFFDSLHQAQQLCDLPTLKVLILDSSQYNIEKSVIDDVKNLITNIEEEEELISAIHLSSNVNDIEEMIDNIKTFPLQLPAYKHRRQQAINNMYSCLLQEYEKQVLVYMKKNDENGLKSIIEKVNQYNLSKDFEKSLDRINQYLTSKAEEKKQMQKEQEEIAKLAREKQMLDEKKIQEKERKRLQAQYEKEKEEKLQRERQKKIKEQQEAILKEKQKQIGVQKIEYSRRATIMEEEIKEDKNRIIYRQDLSKEFQEKLESIIKNVNWANNIKELQQIVSTIEENGHGISHPLVRKAQIILNKNSQMEKHLHTFKEFLSKPHLFEIEKIQKDLETANHLGIKDPILTECQKLVFTSSFENLLSLQLESAVKHNAKDTIEKILFRVSQIKDIPRSLLDILSKARNVVGVQTGIDHFFQKLEKEPVIREWCLPPSSQDEYIDLSEKFYTLQNSSPLSSYARLKSPNDYAKGIFFVDKKIAQSMLVWQKKPIARSLIDFSTRYCQGNKKLASKLKDQSLQCFVNILCFMGDRYHAYPVTVCQELINKAIKEPFLREEIIVQLIKQTTNNPNETSNLLGWQLIYLCLSSFVLKDVDLIHVVSDHISRVANPIMLKYHPFNTVSNVATNCYKVRNISHTKNEAPSISEIQNIVESKIESVISVRCPTHNCLSCINLLVDNELTVDKVIECCYQLVFYTDNYDEKQLAYLNPIDNYGISIEVIHRKTQQTVYNLPLNHSDNINNFLLRISDDFNFSQNHYLYFQLYFYKVKWHLYEVFPLFLRHQTTVINFLYRQCLNDLKKGRYQNVPEEATCYLSAIQLKINLHGSMVSHEELAKAKRSLQTHEQSLRFERWIKEFEKNPKCRRFNTNAWQCRFLRALSSQKSYGSIFFHGQLWLGTAMEARKVNDGTIMGFNWKAIYWTNSQYVIKLFIPLEKIKSIKDEGDTVVFVKEETEIRFMCESPSYIIELVNFHQNNNQEEFPTEEETDYESEDETPPPPPDEKEDLLPPPDDLPSTSDEDSDMPPPSDDDMPPPSDDDMPPPSDDEMLPPPSDDEMPPPPQESKTRAQPKHIEVKEPPKPQPIEKKTFTVNKYQIGDTVRLNDMKCTGTVRYYGNITQKPGVWYGIELDVPLGKHDGLGYFKTASPRCGCFCQENKLTEYKELPSTPIKTPKIIKKTIIPAPIIEPPPDPINDPPESSMPTLKINKLDIDIDLSPSVPLGNDPFIEDFSVASNISTLLPNPIEPEKKLEKSDNLDKMIDRLRRQEKKDKNKEKEGKSSAKYATFKKFGNRPTPPSLKRDKSLIRGRDLVK